MFVTLLMLYLILLMGAASHSAVNEVGFIFHRGSTPVSLMTFNEQHICFSDNPNHRYAIYKVLNIDDVNSLFSVMYWETLKYLWNFFIIFHLILDIYLFYVCSLLAETLLNIIGILVSLISNSKQNGALIKPHSGSFHWVELCCTKH